MTDEAYIRTIEDMDSAVDKQLNGQLASGSQERAVALSEHGLGLRNDERLANHDLRDLARAEANRMTKKLHTRLPD